MRAGHARDPVSRLQGVYAVYLDGPSCTALWVKMWVKTRALCSTSASALPAAHPGSRPSSARELRPGQEREDSEDNRGHQQYDRDHCEPRSDEDVRECRGSGRHGEHEETRVHGHSGHGFCRQERRTRDDIDDRAGRRPGRGPRVIASRYDDPLAAV